MLLLHISDIHLKDPLCHTDEDPELHFRSELIAHASERAAEHGDVDALLVTGDIAFKGVRDEYKAATHWLENLATAVGCNKRRIYIVPGNHDVDRSIFNKVGGARNAVRAISAAGDTDAREKELNEQLSLEDSAENMFASISAYNLFAAKYDCQSYPGRLRWKHSLRIDSRTVLQLHGLNSTLISGIEGNDDAPGKLYLGARQMNVARAPGTINLIMAHHPPEWMSDLDDIQSRLLGTPNIVLFGHKHIQRIQRDVDGPILFSAGSVNPERHEKGWEPAYNLIELSPNDGDGYRTVDIAVRQYHWQSNPSGFVEKINIQTEEPVFRHTIRITGEDSAIADDDAPAVTQGAETMCDQKEDAGDTPSFSSPNIRDLIYRFWELSPGNRRLVLEALGTDLTEESASRQTMTYRKALVALSSDNRLAELEAAIAEKESTL